MVPLPESHKNGLLSLRLTWGEVSGALGDLGVLLPLAAALITVNGLSATGVFFGVGLAYILTGLVYRLPLPIQPLKAVAAIAIAQGLPAGAVTAAGWWMGILLLILAATDAARYLGRLFTRPIIQGIQLGLGLLLVRSGILLALRRELTSGGAEQVVRLASRPVPLGWLLAGAALALLLYGVYRKWPVSLILLAFGVAVSLVWGGAAESLGRVRLGLALPRPVLPLIPDLRSALPLLVLPQIPLTFGNAVFATVDTARAYFGQGARRVTPSTLLTTMSISQSIAALFGGAPVCHGSGGLTAHYKLGARTGAAPVLMGILCLALALFVDGNILPILALIPYPVLGAMLAFVGVQHGLLARHVRGREEAFVVIVTGATGFATSNLALGFAVGMGVQQCGRLLRLLRPGHEEARL